METVYLPGHKIVVRRVKPASVQTPLQMWLSNTPQPKIETQPGTFYCATTYVDVPSDFAGSIDDLVRETEDAIQREKTESELKETRDVTPKDPRSDPA